MKVRAVVVVVVHIDIVFRQRGYLLTLKQRSNSGSKPDDASHILPYHASRRQVDPVYIETFLISPHSARVIPVSVSRVLRPHFHVLDDGPIRCI